MKRITRLHPVSAGFSTIAPGSILQKCLGVIALGVLCWTATIAPATARTHRLNSDEMILFKRISSNSGQQRGSVTLDPILCLVARQRAADMARRNYFSHTNPDGQGANYLVRREGYQLPPHYDPSRSGNNIESLAMATGGAGEIFALWLGSSAHRTHVLGEAAFYREQLSVGVGVARSPRPPYYKYYVFLSAPPNGTPLPQAVTLLSPKGVNLASTRIGRARVKSKDVRTRRHSAD